MNKQELQQLLIASTVLASICQIYSAMGELPIEELPDEIREKCESLRNYANEVGCYFGEYTRQKMNQIFPEESHDD